MFFVVSHMIPPSGMMKTGFFGKLKTKFLPKNADSNIFNFSETVYCQVLLLLTLLITKIFNFVFFVDLVPIQAPPNDNKICHFFIYHPLVSNLGLRLTKLA